LITTFMRICFQPLVRLLCRYEGAIRYISVFEIAVLTLDFIFPFRSMRIHRSYNKRWKIRLKTRNKSENTMYRHDYSYSDYGISSSQMGEKVFYTISSVITIIIPAITALPIIPS